MKPNRLQQVVAEGRVPVGTMVWEFATRGIAQIVEAAGVDFVLLDMEHSAIGLDRIADMLAWFQATTVAPFVRVPSPEYHFVARIMDAGALGVMVPNVETPETARAIVNAVKYAPLGHRGVGLGSAHTLYRNPDPTAYFAEANARSTLICQIESTRGLENAEAIASTPGVDILWVGHFDLTQSMGIPAQFHHPDFLAALARVVDVCRRHGKLAGIQPSTQEQAAEWRALGYNVISWGTDAQVYRNALAAAVAVLR